MTILRERIRHVHARIEQARARSPYGQTVALVAVSKKHPAELIRDYLTESARLFPSSHLVLGENYVQEWAQKRSVLTDVIEQFSVKTHLIGPLQSNKAPAAVKNFDLIESVHNLRLLGVLGRACQQSSSGLDIMLQVNISEDSAKAGFLPLEIAAAYEEALRYGDLRVRGLMTITKEYPEPEGARDDFRRLRELRDELNPALELSMGMSADFEVAIEEGATLVRVGTALFGERIA